MLALLLICCSFPMNDTLALKIHVGGRFPEIESLSMSKRTIAITILNICIVSIVVDLS